MPRWLYGLIVFGLIALVIDFVDGPELLIFILAALGIIPVSGLISRSTEDLAHHVGPKWGGLLNATFGNAAELIIGIVAIRAGLLDLVKASITGSIIGNLLLVLGMGLFVGGIRNGVQRFDPAEAGRNATMMLIALAGLLLPAAFAIADPDDSDIQLTSDAVAIVLIIIYVAYIAYSLTLEGIQTLHDELSPGDDDGVVSGGWSVRLAGGVLLGATLATVVLAEMLVGTVEAVGRDFGLSEMFLGIILVPIIGNVAEHFSAVLFAYKNKSDVALAIAAGSSTQVALLVAPLFVFTSYLFGNQLNLVFTPLEIIVVGTSAFLFSFISNDGESNWLEGFELLGVYVMVGLVFYFLPS